MTVTAEAPALVIGTAEQNYVYAKAMQAMLAADLDDGQAGLARAVADKIRVDTWYASVCAAGAPGYIRASVAKLTDPAAQKKAAAEDRVKAATDALSAIRKVVETAADDAQHMGRLFGTWYGNAGKN